VKLVTVRARMASSLVATGKGASRERALVDPPCDGEVLDVGAGAAVDEGSGVLDLRPLEVGAEIQDIYAGAKAGREGSASGDVVGDLVGKNRGVVVSRVRKVRQVLSGRSSAVRLAICKDTSLTEWTVGIPPHLIPPAES
jgi:hypothetical protein